MGKPPARKLGPGESDVDLTPVHDLGGIADPLEFGLEFSPDNTPSGDVGRVDLGDLSGDLDLGGIADPLEFGQPDGVGLGFPGAGLGEDLPAGLGDLGSDDVPLADLELQPEGFEDPGGIALEDDAIDLEDPGKPPSGFTDLFNTPFASPPPAPEQSQPSPAPPSRKAEDRPPPTRGSPSTLASPSTEGRAEGGVRDAAPAAPGPARAQQSQGKPRLVLVNGRWTSTADASPKGVVKKGDKSPEGSSGGQSTAAGEGSRPQRQSPAPGSRPPRPAQETAGALEDGSEDAIASTPGPSADDQLARPRPPASRPPVKSGRIILLAVYFSAGCALISISGLVFLRWAMESLGTTITEETAVQDADREKIAGLLDRRAESRREAEYAQGRVLRLSETAEDALERALSPRTENRYGVSSALLKDFIQRFPDSDLVSRARTALAENERLGRTARSGTGGA